MVAVNARSMQRTMFPPPPLTLPSVGALGWHAALAAGMGEQCPRGEVEWWWWCVGGCVGGGLGGREGSAVAGYLSGQLQVGKASRENAP